MGMKETWQRKQREHWATYGSYYERASKCKDTHDGLDAMVCAAEIMKEIKVAKRNARFGGS